MISDVETWTESDELLTSRRAAILETDPGAFPQIHMRESIVRDGEPRGGLLIALFVKSDT